MTPAPRSRFSSSNLNPCRSQIWEAASSSMAWFRLANTFSSINSIRIRCGLVPISWASCRTTMGGFMLITLLPSSSTVKSASPPAALAGEGVTGRTGATDGLGVSLAGVAAVTASSSEVSMVGALGRVVVVVDAGRIVVVVVERAATFWAAAARAWAAACWRASATARARASASARARASASTRARASASAWALASAWAWALAAASAWAWAAASSGVT